MTKPVLIAVTCALALLIINGNSELKAEVLIAADRALGLLGISFPAAEYPVVQAPQSDDICPPSFHMTDSDGCQSAGWETRASFSITAQEDPEDQHEEGVINLCPLPYYRMTPIFGCQPTAWVRSHPWALKGDTEPTTAETAPEAEQSAVASPSAMEEPRAARTMLQFARMLGRARAFGRRK